MKQYFILFLLFFPLLCTAQWHDNYWHFGRWGGTPIWGVTEIDFTDIQHVKSYKAHENSIDFWSSDVSISDSVGNLLYISQGTRAYDAHFQVMANGTMLSNRDDGSGARLYQGALSFPVPNSTYLYYLFTVDDTLAAAIGTHLYVHTVDMTKKNGLG